MTRAALIDRELSESPRIACDGWRRVVIQLESGNSAHLARTLSGGRRLCGETYD